MMRDDAGGCSWGSGMYVCVCVDIWALINSNVNPMDVVGNLLIKMYIYIYIYTYYIYIEIYM